MQFNMSDSACHNDKVYGCIFCTTGKEDLVARYIETANPNIRALPVRQQKRKKVDKHTSIVEEICFPGYVFIEADVGSSILLATNISCMIKLLSSKTKDWKLYGDDEAFARWIFARSGIISFSKGYKEGDRIKISSGPLKDLEGHIVRIDKRNKNGQVSLTFHDRVIKAWLGFELIDNT